MLPSLSYQLGYLNLKDEKFELPEFQLYPSPHLKPLSSIIACRCTPAFVYSGG